MLEDYEPGVRSKAGISPPPSLAKGMYSSEAMMPDYL